MTDPAPKRAIVIAAAAFAAGALAVGVVWGSVALGWRGDSPASETHGSPDTPKPGRTNASSDPSAAPADSAPTVECPRATVTVGTADDLHAALADASPGDVIVLEPGRFVGNFVATVSGSAGSLITLCGSSQTILDGGGWEHGYVFHLDGAQYWHLFGFAVANGQKGVMADGTAGSIIEGLTVSQIGDEAIHLRKFSTDNSVIGNDISNTGLRRPKFGEGVYIGTAESNWCDISNCDPDTSDRNLVADNVIYGTTSESVDIKEGTSGGTLRGNSFDGSSIIDADSWVDVKGTGWLIEGNVGVNSPLDGFQTHEIVDGWGTDNIFRGNTANVNGPGFGYSLTPVRGNVVECSNTASNAGEGLSNVSCAD